MNLQQKAADIHSRMLDTGERGLALAVLRSLLLPPSWLYGLAARARNFLYDTGCLKGRRAGLPVVSVGNITAGGTGKTPFCAWLTNVLREVGRRPAILSRGYGRDDSTGVDDENELLGALAPDVPVVVNPDRCEGARAARSHLGADLVVLDDGFQHRRLARDVDIVLVDALRPFGGGYMLPRGLLREPADGLRRADIIVLTRSDLVDVGEREDIEARLREFAPNAPVAHAAHRATALQRLVPGGGREEAGLSELETGRWGAFCGIGNPDAFRLTLRRKGAELGLFRPFPDHYDYSADAMAETVNRAQDAGCDALVTTAKDAVKVSGLLQTLPQMPMYVLEVEMEVTAGREELRRVLPGDMHGDGE